MHTSYPLTTFMTGATGFLGHYVLRDLLERGQRVVAILRPPITASQARLVAALTEIGLDAQFALQQGRLVVVEGALPDRLPEPTWGRTDYLLHNAASLQLFANGNGDPFGTNVEGTEAILRWAGRAAVRNVFAVSTAYTCGWNQGLIAEQFHYPPPRFQTDYERTKWLAEALYQQWAAEPEHTLTVFRPSFLVGDSQTGYTTQFAGFYQFARLVGVLKQQYNGTPNGERTYIPLRIPGRPDDVQNVVPVDFVSRLMAEVISRPDYHGRIFHLTNPSPPTNDTFKQCYEDYYRLYGGYFAEPGEVVGKCTPAESLLWDEYHLLTPRVVHTPRFDMTNTEQVMAECDTPFPTLDRERILMLIDWAAARGWGRHHGNNGNGRSRRKARQHPTAPT